MKKKASIMGIRKKLLLSIVPVVVVILALVVLVAYQSSKNTINEKTMKLLEIEADSCVHQLSAWQNQNIGILDTAVDTIINLKMTDEELLHYGSYYLETYNDFPNGLYITCENGDYLDPSGYEMEIDPREGRWYIEGVNHPTFSFGEAYLDSYTNSYIVSATRWIEDLNGRGAVVAADVDLSILAEVVQAAEVEGGGDAFIIDLSTGLLLAHKDESLLGDTVQAMEDSFYADVFNTAQNGNMQTQIIPSKAGAYMVAMRAVPGTEWVVALRVLEQNIYRDVYILAAILCFLGIISVIVILLLTYVIVSKITKPIHALTNTILAVTEGDFTTDVVVTGNDEVSVMATSMKEFMRVMRKTIGSIIAVSKTIDSQAQNSNMISGELHESAIGQAEAMNQLRYNLQELVESISIIAENATTLAAVVSTTNDEGAEALKNIESTMDIAQTGKSSMISVNDSMEIVFKGMQILEDSIQNVGTCATKINEITTTISSIAEETNLLSLNASIEAARAGEAGKGFAVVATEIKKLAETSGNASEEIAQLIQSVSQQIEETVIDSQNSMKQIQNSVELADLATKQFEQIYQSIETTNSIIQEIISKIVNVNDVATNMAAITQEQSASAEEIEATAISIQELADNVTNNSANVKDNSTTLAGTSEQLNKYTSKFMIE